jgi:putative hemolysin
VVNEFATVEGIITLHNIMEAIVGDLPDLDESTEPDVHKREDGSYLVSGSVLVRHLNQSLGIAPIPEAPERYTSQAGFVLYQLSSISKVGTKFIVENFEFEVLNMDGSRIDKVLLHRMTHSGDGETPTVAVRQFLFC